MKSIPDLDIRINKHLKTGKPFRAGDIINIKDKLYIIERDDFDDGCGDCDLNSDITQTQSCLLWKVLNSKYRDKDLICSDLLPQLIFKELKEGI